MHREHGPGSGAVWPVSQRITQHLMRDFIKSWLVEQHEIGRVTRQGLYGDLPEEASHTAGQGLEGGHSEARTFLYHATTKKPAYPRPEERAQVMGPALGWMGGE